MHIVKTADYLGPIKDSLIWWIGETPSGLGIEIAGISHEPGAIIIIHAMPLWRK